MKNLVTLFIIISTSLATFGQVKTSSELQTKLGTTDTLYTVVNSKEITFFNGIEAPEDIKPDFVLKENDKTMELEIDKNCEVNNISSCVSLFHLLPSNKNQFGNKTEGVQKGKGYKWTLKSSMLSKDEMQVTFGQKIGEDGNVTYSTVDVSPNEIIDMGYGSVGTETNRYVWIVFASWK
jgi:hypothetical protein